MEVYGGQYFWGRVHHLTDLGHILVITLSASQSKCDGEDEVSRTVTGLNVDVQFLDNSGYLLVNKGCSS